MIYLPLKRYTNKNGARKSSKEIADSMVALCITTGYCPEGHNQTVLLYLRT